MVGPSSSHTAGAVRLGLLARNIYSGNPSKVTFKLYNSYASTGKGHGTDKGILAGFLGLSVDDVRIRNIFDLEISKSIDYSFEYIQDFKRSYIDSNALNADGPFGCGLCQGNVPCQTGVPKGLDDYDGQ